MKESATNYMNFYENCNVKLNVAKKCQHNYNI